MVYKTGDAVKSKAGHDKGECYIVLSVKDDMLHLVNGKTRGIDSPKQKKQKHCQYIGTIDIMAANDLQSRSGRFIKNAGTSDSEIRKLLKAFENGDSENNER